MSTRSVVVRLEAEVSKYVSGMKASQEATERAKKAQEQLGETTEKMTKSQREEARKAADAARKAAEADRKRAEATQAAGTAMLAFGTTTVAALGASAKAAIDWESAWAGVQKTVDGTPEQMAAVEEGLRDLARELPSTHQEIAAVAESAGQLGVAREDIVGFTRTMIDLGETTNLTAEEAATNIAQISNVMGTMEREGSAGVARFGAALVALGNDGASTEAEILNMAQRIAGAAATVGASESDVLALSNTLASMGVRAELGGGVATRVLLRMREAVDEGGDSLSAFAETAGMSAEEFSTAFREDPVAALGAVSQGINGVNEAGGNVTATLKEMGIKGTEEVSVMLALANSGDLLTESLQLGEEAWKSNSALAEEAAKRYATTESQIKVAWNNIKDAAIDAGAVLLPIIAGAAETISGLAQAYQGLPEPVQGTLTALAGVAGVAALAGGAFVTLAPKVQAARDIIRDLRGVTPGAERNVGKLGRTAAIAAKGIGALAIVGPAIAAWVDDGNKADPTKLADELFRIGSGGKAAATGLSGLDSMFNTGGKDWFSGLDVGGLEDAFRIIGNPDVFDNVDQTLSTILSFGTRDSSNLEFVTKNFEELDRQLTSMHTSGAADQAAAAYEDIAAKAEAAGVPVAKLAEIFPQYAGALAQSSVESQGAAAGAETLGGAMSGVGEETEAVVESMADLLDQMFQAGILTMSARDAQAAYQASLAGVDDAIKQIAESEGAMGRTLNKAKTDFDLTTEAGRLANESFQAIADDGMAKVTALAEDGVGQPQLQKHLEKTVTDLTAAGVAFGLPKEQAAALAREVMGIPPGVSIEAWMSENGIGTAEATKAAVEAIPGYKVVAVTVSENGTAGSVQARINEVTGKTEYVFVTDDGTTTVVQQEIRSIDGVDRTVWVDDNGTVYGTQAEINGIKGKTVTVTAVAHVYDAELVLNSLARNRTAYINTVVRAPERPVVTQVRALQQPNWGGYTGGRVPNLPGYDTGGRLPYTGLGRDMILGVASDGRPVARVDDGEWVIRESSADKYDRLLSLVNADHPSVQHLAGYAEGGRPVASTQVMASAGAGFPNTSGTRPVVFEEGAIQINGVGDEHIARVLRTELSWAMRNG